jgi:putative PEP-CTERM system histidine kinase
MILAPESGFWQALNEFSHFAGACASVTVAGLLLGRRERFGPAGAAVIVSLVMTAAYCLAAAVAGAQSLPTQAALALRNLAYVLAVYRLFAGDGRHTSFAPVRPVVITVGIVNLLLPLAELIESSIHFAPAQIELVFHLNVMLAMLVVVGSLVLVHNLYAGAVQPFRAMLRWPVSALALVWGYELNLYTVAYLGNRWPVELASIHGLIDLCFAAVLGIGVSRGAQTFRLRPSRAVTFHSLSLLLIGSYFVAMVAVAQWLAYAGGDFARWLEFSFLVLASAAALLTLPSRRVRAKLRVTLNKHLFQHRYDYRAEWLRFTRTMSGRAADAERGETSGNFHERVIQAVADVTDSAAGLLLTPGEQGDLTLAAAWQWPHADVPAWPLGANGGAFFGRGHGFIVDLDRLRAGFDQRGERAFVPDWLLAKERAWAAVPLLHFDRLVGMVVLGRPLHARTLDWEDFDLLRVVGQQLASYLAEHDVQQALVEAGRFDDFHRRIAFVMHDIKNLSSQFSLLARNAERHAENPAFRADMLLTLRSSADKLNNLVSRLSRYGAGSPEKLESVDVGSIARTVAGHYQDRHPVTVIERTPCRATANRDSLEQVLTHLVQNGVDASAAESPVFIAIASDGMFASIEIVDSGRGMSPEFVRSRLFKPFDSSKPGGFGIGAYEARELVRAMGGRIEVESREGLGSRFVIRVPLASASTILKTLETEKYSDRAAS